MLNYNHETHDLGTGLLGYNLNLIALAFCDSTLSMPLPAKSCDKQVSAKSQNADLCREFITERKWINFGTVLEGTTAGEYQKIASGKFL